MRELVSIQKEFQNHLLQAEEAIPNFFVTTKKVSALERIKIYSNAYQLRLLEALATNYPALKIYLAEKKFTELGLNYINGHPSYYRSIRWFGDKLAEFMASATMPFAAELARLEWLLAEVFDAADADVIDIDTVAQIPAEQWPGMTFQLHPSVKRLDLLWNTLKFWQAVINAEKKLPKPQRLDSTFSWVFWRKDLATHFYSLKANEARTFDLMCTGATWGDICEMLCEHLSVDEVPFFAAGLLKRWVVEGMISAAIINNSAEK